MDLKKAFDQTVREFKREVNKVLKVPEIEQKVLDVTSNEPWGPHGTVMADIAQATRNYNDYQMIMAIIWKRINDTGRNWRHVYKALSLLEFLVAHGSERVIDDLREHVYQLSTLADFQYIDSGGRDQGLNVRKKSQSLVTLVNDKEKIREARQKAVENRDKYRGLASTGGMYKPSSYYSTGGSYGSDKYAEDSYGSNSRYGNREDDRYGRERDGDRDRDEDRYGRDWDRNDRLSDRSNRGDGYKDDYNRDHDREEDRYNSRRGNDKPVDRYRSYDRDRDRSFDDDDGHSSRSGQGKGDEYGVEDRRTSTKFSDSRTAAPPSYEETLGSPNYRAEDRRDGGSLADAVTRVSKSDAAQINSLPKAPAPLSQSDDLDEFDPRASTASTPPFQVDQPFSHAEQGATVQKLSPAPPSGIWSAPSSGSINDLFGDPGAYSLPPPTGIMQEVNSDVFGDSPFKAETPALATTANTSATFDAAISVFSDGIAATGSRTSSNIPPAYASVLPPMPATFLNTDSFSAHSAVPPPVPGRQLSDPPPVSTSFGSGGLFGDESFTTAFAPSTATSFGTSVPPQVNQSWPAPAMASSIAPSAVASFNTSIAPQMNQITAPFTGASQLVQPVANQLPKVNSLPTSRPQQQEKKFETKSSVWADTLNKGLIDLNIAGPKSNPLAGIGIDFDLLRAERIKEERTSSKSSTVTMGKAMGSGSGLGLAGAGAIVPPSAPVMMSNMGLTPGMGMTPPLGMGLRPSMGPVMGMGNPMMQMSWNPGMQSAGMGAGIGMNMGMGMAMNNSMGMGMGTGNQRQYNGYR